MRRNSFGRIAVVFGVLAFFWISAAEAAGPVWMPGFPLRAGANVLLMWNPVPGATSYKVYRTETPGKNYAPLGEVPANNYMDPNVSNTKSYYYIVKPVTGGKEGEASAEIAMKGVEPTPKTNITGHLITSEGKISLRWDIVPTAAFYNLYRGDAKGGPYALLTSLQDTKYTDAKVSEGKTYFYSVTAVSAASMESEKSAPYMVKLVKEEKVVEKTIPLVPVIVKSKTMFMGEAKYEMSAPTDVEVGPDGRVFVADELGTIQVFDADGNYQSRFGGPKDPKEQATWGVPWGLGIDPKTYTIYVTYMRSKKIRAFDKEGNLLKQFEYAPPKNPPEPNFTVTPYDVAVGIDGKIWVTEGGFFQVVALDQNGNEVARVGRPRGQKEPDLKIDFASPSFLTVDRATGNVHVNDVGAQRIVVLDKAGKRLFTYGTGGESPGKFAIPKGIFFANGLVYVVDGANSRIQAFTPEGEYKYQFTDDSKKTFFRGSYTCIAMKGKLMYLTEKASSRVRIFDIP